MTDRGDLDRVLGQIDTLLPPGAPDEDWSVSPDAMRWAPAEQDDHPDAAALEPRLPLFPRYLPAVADVMRWDINFGQQAASRFADAMRSATIVAEHASYNFAEVLARLEAADHLGLLDTGEDRAAALIEARRNRNTGPGNPHGLDGRARRRHHPTRAASDTAIERDEFRWVSWSDVRARRHGHHLGSVWVDEIQDWDDGSMLLTAVDPRSGRRVAAYDPAFDPEMFR